RVRPAAAPRRETPPRPARTARARRRTPASAGAVLDVGRRWNGFVDLLLRLRAVAETADAHLERLHRALDAPHLLLERRMRRDGFDRAAHHLVEPALQLAEPIRHAGELLHALACTLRRGADHFHAAIDRRRQVLQRRLPVLDQVTQE